MTTPDQSTSRHHVVIIGCGFGGLFAAQGPRRGPVRVTLIDRTNHHLFQPLLYQVATGILSEGQIAPPSATSSATTRPRASCWARWSTSTWRPARSTWTSSVSRVTIDYDSLIVAGGAATSYFGHDEFRDAASGMKSLDDALACEARSSAPSSWPRPRTTTRPAAGS